MPFGTTKYLEWAKQKPQVSYSLAGSSFPHILPEDIGFSWAGLRFSGDNSYGYPPFVEAIAAYQGVTPAGIAAATGTSMANFLVMAALIEAGDEVVVERPCYGPMLDVALSLGAAVRRLDRRFDEAFAVDVSRLQQLVSRKTRLVVLTNLHNPSGVRIPDEVLREIGDIAGSLGFHVLVDEVYLDFVAQGRPSTCHALGSPFIATNSLTKVYGLDGLRAGWVTADAAIVRRVQRVRDHVDGVGSYVAEAIAARCIEKLPEILGRSKARMTENVGKVRSFVDSRPELSWVPPDGGAVCFPRHPDAARLDRIVRLLPLAYDTLVVPGGFFESDSHFRLGFGAPPEILAEGLRRLGRALDEVP